ncbi:MAG: hypothetical protein ACO1RX_12060 [Candidatus Sericytochromatia bacterium]
MDDPRDEIQFHAAPVVRDAGIYRTPLQAKGAKERTLPVVGSRILNAPAVQSAYATFGLEGLKSILLQEMVRLDWEILQDELAALAEAANAHKELKRTLRATKLLASQWMEDHRQPEAVKDKCRYIFDSISTFGVIEIQPPDNAANQMNQFAVQFPNLGPLEPVGAEVEHTLNPGSGLLLMTDLQGHFDKLKTMLLNTQMAQEREGILHWTAPPDLYLVLVGDLFNKSPYSTWGDGVGQEVYPLIKTLQRFLKIAPERVLISYGAYDLDLAMGAAFDHPVSGFMGDSLGVNAQAQALPATLSFIQGTGQPESPDFAWDYDAESGSWLLKESYQIQGFPQLQLPDAGQRPDLSPLLNFYEQLYQRLIHPQIEQRPRTIQEVDALAAGLLPPAHEQLNLQNLASSLGRCLHYKGLLSGSGTLRFLREQVAGMHVLHVGEKELFAMHPEIQEISLDMLMQLKPRGSDAWQAPELESFVRQSLTLRQRRIDPERLLVMLRQARFSQLNDWLALPEDVFFRRLVQLKQLNLWAPEIVPKADEKGFCEAWRSLRWELINEDSAGLAGYALNMDGVPRRGEPLMRRMAALDERTRRSYARTFLMDLMREELPLSMQVQPEGIVIEFPDSSNPSLTISLLLDEAVSIYRDPKENLHMPVKHAAWLEYRG